MNSSSTSGAVFSDDQLADWCAEWSAAGGMGLLAKVHLQTLVSHLLSRKLEPAEVARQLGLAGSGLEKLLKGAAAAAVPVAVPVPVKAAEPVKVAAPEPEPEPEPVVEEQEVAEHAGEVADGAVEEGDEPEPERKGDGTLPGFSV